MIIYNHLIFIQENALKIQNKLGDTIKNLNTEYFV